MRFVTYFLVALLAVPSLALAKKTAMLSVRVKGHYSTQSTTITREGSEWHCQTEIMPLYVSPVQPFSDELLTRLRAQSREPAQSAACRDRVWVADHTQGMLKEYSGCADDPIWTRLLNEIAKNCGRN